MVDGRGRPPTPEHRIPHGTRSGYRMETKRGLPHCDPCRAEERKYQAQKRAQRREIRRLLRQVVGRAPDQLTPAEKEEVDTWIEWMRAYARANTRRGETAGGSGSSSTEPPSS